MPGWIVIKGGSVLHGTGTALPADLDDRRTQIEVIDFYYDASIAVAEGQIRVTNESRDYTATIDTELPARVQQDGCVEVTCRNKHGLRFSFIARPSQDEANVAELLDDLVQQLSADGCRVWRS